MESTVTVKHRQPPPPPSTVSATEAARGMRSILDRVHLGERIVVEHAGRPIAVITKWTPENGGAA